MVESHLGGHQNSNLQFFMGCRSESETGEEKPIILDLAKDLVYQYMVTLRSHDDEIAIILKGHLFIEYVLNGIVRKCCRSPRNILRDLRFTFSIKLQLVYSMGLLPTPIYKNIIDN